MTKDYAIGNNASPGRVGWLACQQERSNIVGSCHAIWGNLNELDNMIFRQSGTWRTKGEWWWWTKYGSLTGTRVSTTAGTNIDLIAAKDPDSSLAKIVLGNKGGLANQQVTVQLNNLNLSTAMEGKQVFVVIEHIPYQVAGGFEVKKTDIDTVLIGNMTVDASNSLSLNFTWGSKDDSYVIRLGSKQTSQTFEAEDITSYTYTTGRTVQTTVDANCSGGKFRSFSADAANDFIRFVLPNNINPGKYLVTLRVKKYTSRGYSLLNAMNASSSTGSDIGTAQDLYSSTAKYEDINLKYWIVNSSSLKTFKFTATTVNDSSIAPHRYTLAYDYFKVTPLSNN
ncbi:hypothetical protein GS399_05010 [Pedobacter sp. HMF7647]|uniref:Uncharacterized protein n=1 Tax=Hufsiella arboris TaxID=2695275 RepID=A0A7K1Y6X8_9SPHI|nr:hypothetical protein [Hufsiella arboris]MXV50323.1 hypothetical protein [Hufsiella arboris]